MRLRELQSVFAILVAHLLLRAHIMGLEVTLGEAWRSEAEAHRRGFSNSNHRRRLAIDINLFKDGKWLTRTEDHQELGEWWEQQHPLARWGGRFGDGNHYSLEWNGVK